MAMGIDLTIVLIVSGFAIALHVVLFVLFRRWMDRDLALSLAGDDPGQRQYMLDCLQRARRTGIRRRDLPVWLQQEAATLQPPAA